MARKRGASKSQETIEEPTVEPEPETDPDVGEPDPSRIEVGIFCEYTKLVRVEDVRPNPMNPNTHTESQVRLLARLLIGHGWRSPITVSEQSGLIVRGHGRLLAAQLLGVETVPVDVQSYESPEMELADLVADNAVAELSTLDPEMLREALEEIGRADVDSELAGIIGARRAALDRELRARRGTTEGEGDDDAWTDPEKTGDLDYRCPKCGYEWDGAPR